MSNFALLVLILLSGSIPGQDAGELLRTGIRQFEEGRLVEAAATLEESARLSPDDPVLRLHLGQVYEALEAFDRAVASWRKAIRLAPAEGEAYLRLALLQARLGRLAQAQSTLRELRQQGEVPEAVLLEGRLASAQQEFPEAEQRLRRYLELRPDDPVGLSELGAVLLAQLKPAEAEPWLLKALERDSGLGTAHFNLGMLYRGRGELAQALPHLQAASTQLDTATSYLNLGTLLAELEQPEAAEEALRRALRLDPENAEAYYSLARLVRRQGRVGEADQLLSRHQQLGRAQQEQRARRRRVDSLHAEARQLLEQDQVAGAEALLTQILELDPGNHLAFYRLGQLEYLRRRYMASLSHARSARDSSPVEPSYLFLEAMSLEKLGRSEQARSTYQAVLDLFPYAGAHQGLARLAAASGDYASALDHLERAVEMEPDDPELHLELAAVLEQVGRPEEAALHRSRAGDLQNHPRQDGSKQP